MPLSRLQMRSLLAKLDDHFPWSSGRLVTGTQTEV
uniref:Uncharacterized protein n=1 Tax=Anguilla anguilla TaxID=7936 RepID=A0A0E9REF4_ANGAN